MSGGVLVINDSKATNAEAAGRALGAFDRVRWIAGRARQGGRDRRPRPALRAHRHAYLIGEAAEGFAATLGDTPHDLRRSGERAARALAEAAPGEVVLLSPAAASFDQFRDFEARGEAFRALVAPHLEEGG